MYGRMLPGVRPPMRGVENSESSIAAFVVLATFAGLIGLCKLASILWPSDECHDDESDEVEVWGGASSDVNDSNVIPFRRAA